MELDSFLISILFDNAKAIESAKKIENTVNSLKDKILGAFAAILSVDFLKNAVESSVQLTTKLDNLSYATNISKENLNAWGEAAKRSGGTVEGFYTSVSSLSDKIREMQTNFGSSGQLVFARLGINIKDSTGHIKNAVQILGEVGDKFKNLPKVWQQNLGQQLGLDQATIRLISDGNAEAQKLVVNMAKLGQINQLNSERNIKFRNSLYDISLVFESIKLKIADGLIPVLQRFSELLLKGLTFLQEHSKVVRAVVLALSVMLSGALLSAIISVTGAIIAFGRALLINPVFLLTTALVALGLIIQDFIVYLNGGKAAFSDFYDMLSNENIIKQLEKLGNKIKNIFSPLTKFMKDTIDSFRYLFGSLDETVRSADEIEDEFVDDKEITQKVIKEHITKTALQIGVDPSVAHSIANIESGLNPNAKNATSSASGIFQLTNATAQDNGISDLSKKNNVHANIKAGVTNLKKITDGLTQFFHRSPTGAEVYLGEMFGLAGSQGIFSANKNTMLSSILNPSVLKANPQYKNMTAGQLINNSNKTYSQKSVTVGEVKINAPNSDARQISKHITTELQKHLSNLTTNIDNGIRS